MYRLALLLLVASASACPSVPECSCELRDGELLYRCDVGGARFTIKAVFNSYLKITCQSGNFSSDLMPTLELSRGGAFSSVSLTSCDVPVLSHLLARVGAKGVDKLMLNNPKGALETRHLAGSAGISSVYIFYTNGAAAHQHSVPYDVISMLPSLQDFRLHGAPLTLHPALHTSLRVLELSVASIQNLDPGLFSNLKNLRELLLSGNRIEEIKSGAFDGLSSLQFLDLSINPLTHLSAGALRGAGRLARLHLAHTNLTVIRTGALADSPRLTEIKLECGKNQLTLETQALANLQYLNNVNLKSTNLSGLPADLFTNSTAIESIDFSDCSLTNIPPTLLRDQKNLKRLNLNSNRIITLPVGLFDNLIKLEGLKLSSNLIWELPENTFAGLSNLLTLSLDRNQLTTVSDAAFTGLMRLLVLDLSHNQLTFKRNIIEEVNRSPLVDLTKLHVLKLNDNAIEIVFDDWRMSLYNLEYIDLSWNRIRKLRKKDMEFLPKKIAVDLRHNLISTIEISDNLRSSTTLFLAFNPYNCDCELYPFLDYVKTHNTGLDLSSTFCNTPPNLKSESLKNVSLTSLSCPLSDCSDNCSCTLLPAASSIYLDCKAVPSFYPEPKQYNMTSIKLKLRNLKNNVLPIFSPEVVSLNLSGIGLIKAPSIPKTLKEIDLSLNQLATIPRAISKLNATLYIAGNPIQCSCENKDDIEALLERSDGIADGGKVNCVNGGPLLSVKPSNLCEVWWAATVGIFVAAFGLGIAVLVVFVFIYCDEIKRFIYKQGWNLLIYEEELDGRKYDVLVSYGDEVEKFVVQKFVPELEKRGYTVSARYKDWDIGVWIPTKVAESIDESRRVVVIPTESYMSSVISMELKAAQLAQMGQKRKRLLIVVKDENEFEPFKEFKCLKWDNTCFWEKLDEELPKRRKKCEEIVSQATLNVLMTSEGKVAFARNKAR